MLFSVTCRCWVTVLLVLANAARRFRRAAHGDFMKTLFAVAVGMVPSLGTDVALAQSGNMMDGGMWGGGWMGGYGGYWMPILVLVVVVGLVVWIVKRK